MSGNLNEYGITHLRHVDLAVPGYQTQRTFYRDTWGLTEVGTDGDLSYLAAEGSPEPSATVYASLVAAYRNR